MKRIIIAVLLSFLMITLTAGCDITNLVTQENQNNKQKTDGEIENASDSVFQGEDKSTGKEVLGKSFMDSVKTNPDIQYKTTNREGFYLIGPLNSHIINIQWDSSNSVVFRAANREKTIISKAVIDVNGVKSKAMIEAPANGIYISDTLKEGRGSVFISWMKEKNFYWYKNDELKEYKNIQYYYISPLQKYVLLFPGDLKTKPILIDLASGKEITLPLEVDHGWPEYLTGISFSSDETKLLYEDWSSMELCIYDIKANKELIRISDKGFNLLEGVMSPSGKMAAYLKYDKNQESINMEEGRDPIGQKLVIYDLEKKKVLKEVSGEEFIYLKPIWSSDGKYLAFNMIHKQNEKEIDSKLYGSPYLLNVSTGKTTKLSNNKEGLKYAIAWSDGNRKLLVDNKSMENINSLSAIDIKLGDELDIDKNKYYISEIKKSGTSIYEIISMDNSKLEQFNKKANLAFSLDEKYIAFGVTIDENEYLAIAPK